MTAYIGKRVARPIQFSAAASPRITHPETLLLLFGSWVTDHLPENAAPNPPVYHLIHSLFLTPILTCGHSFREIKMPGCIAPYSLRCALAYRHVPLCFPCTLSLSPLYCP